MTQQIINIGTTPGDSTGDPAYIAFTKSNENFTELYAKGGTEGVWNFNATSTDTSTAPVSGRFKTNSGNYRDATQIAIHGTTIQGIDRDDTLRTLRIGDIIQCQDRSNGAAWCRYVLQALPTDNTTWFQLTVALDSDGGVASGDNQEIIFTFTANISGGGGGGITDAPSDGVRYVRQNAGWVSGDAAYATPAQVVLKADLVSPTFTGDPKAPTPATADNDTSIATTAFVKAQSYLTGNQTVTLSGDVTGAGTTAIAATIANNAVSNAKLADMATARLRGRVTAGTGDPEDLTGTQATTLLDVVTSSLKGLAPASGGGTTNFLRADGTWSAPAGGTTYTGVPGHGRLIYVSATQLKFNPFNGDKIKINGALYDIPAAGIAIANTGVNIGGSPGQNLAANSAYLVGLYDGGGGTLTPYFVSILSGHSTSTTAGNVGTEIVAANSISLIGMVYTNASAQFVDSATQRLVRSWFNRVPRDMATTSAQQTTTSTTYVEFNTGLSRLEFVLFNDDLVTATIAASFRTSNISWNAVAAIGIDGSGTIAGVTSTSTADNCSLGLSVHRKPAEGYHYMAMFGLVDDASATATFGTAARPIAFTGRIG